MSSLIEALSMICNFRKPWNIETDHRQLALHHFPNTFAVTHNLSSWICHCQSAVHGFQDTSAFSNIIDKSNVLIIKQFSSVRCRYIFLLFSIMRTWCISQSNCYSLHLNILAFPSIKAHFDIESSNSLQFEFKTLETHMVTYCQTVYRHLQSTIAFATITTSLEVLSSNCFQWLLVDLGIENTSTTNGDWPSLDFFL